VAYAFPKVKLVTTAVDPEINDKFYILPGIGKFLSAVHISLASLFTPCGRGTVVLSVSCQCAYCFPETTHGKITTQTQQPAN